MSERGYDSDAQFMSTPNRTDPSGRSPTNRPLRRLELSDLIEQSHERSEAERWLANGNHSSADSRESAFGMRFIPTPNGTLRGVSSTFHTPQDTKGSQIHGRGSAGLETTRDLGKKMNYVRSAPSLSSTNEDEALPTINIPSGIDEETLMTDWKNFLRASRHRYGMASSGSLPPPSPDLVVARTRQPSHSGRSFTDPRSIHLSEMNISKQLGSQSVSSGSLPCSPSIAELVRKNQCGTLTASSQENIQLRQMSSTSTASRLETRGQASHPRDPSSLYSRHSSAPPVDSPGSQSIKQSEDKATGGKAFVNERIPSEHTIGDDIPPPDQRVLSRFREHCDSGSLPLRAKSRMNGINTLSPPRKVSAGWMSGGRRVGYGYSLVEEAEGEHLQPHQDNGSHRSQAPNGKAEVVVVDGDNRNDPPQSQGQILHPPETTVSSIQSHDTHSTPHISRPATLERVMKNANPASEYPAPAFLQGVLGSHSSQDQGPTGNLTNEKIADTLRPRNPSPIIRNGHCEVAQNQQSSSNSDTNFARQWARLSRSVNVHPGSSKTKIVSQKTWTIGAPHPAKEPQIATLINSPDDAEYHDANGSSMNEDPTLKPQENVSRAARWGLKFSRNRESRRISNLHRQDPSQTSSSAYEECDSSSLKRVTSLKSNPNEDGIEMPGSFEGSRWASRISRMF